MSTDIARHHPGTTIICLLAACMEGYDLQSAGIVAPRLVRAFHLRPDQLGWIFSAGTAGLFFGAILGGIVSDRVGRKKGLIFSALLFGLFSIASGLAQSFETLVLMRLLTGFGLGSALPNIIALVSENGARNRGAVRVTMVSACMPVGGAAASILALSYPSLGWQGIFHAGGVLPIILAVAAIYVLPAKADVSAAIDSLRSETQRNEANLLGRELWVRSVALWVSSFCILLILYVMLNWLPILMEAKGAGASTGLLAAMGFALAGAAGGASLGLLLGRAGRPTVLILAHAGMLLSLFAVTMVEGRIATLLAFSTTGFFIAGAQFLIYGVSGDAYTASLRGRGVGTSVAVGRLGGIAGPALAAVILTVGASADTVIFALIPVVMLSLIAVIVLARNLAATRAPKPLSW